MPDGTLINTCIHKSAGCSNCYAESIVRRWWKKAWGEFPGYTAALLKLGTPVLVEEELNAVLRLSSRIAEGKGDPSENKIFWNDMTDEFLDFWPDEFIDKLFAVRALTPNLIHQVLTKRPDRMRAYMANVEREALWMNATAEVIQAYIRPSSLMSRGDWSILNRTEEWLPLPNVHLGTSVEDQKTADERIPLLLQTPAAVRFISYEPALGPVDLTKCGPMFEKLNRLRPHQEAVDVGWYENRTPLDWVIVGAESGSGARQMDLAWPRLIVEQCKTAGVAVFVKQLGSRPVDWRHDEPEVPPYEFSLSKKGGDMSEWPADLQVREFPKAKAPTN